MRFLRWPRSCLVLALAPTLTLAISALAIVLSLFGVNEYALQRFPRAWARIILAAAGVRVTVRGGRSLVAGRPYIFAANHTSQFDIFVLQGYLGHDFRWMAKKELFEIPVFGRGMRRAGYIPVDRSRGREALKSLREAARRIANGTSVIIFPEGTRSPDGKLKPFKTGAMVLAIKSGVPVVPVAIRGAHEVLPKGRLLCRPGHIAVTLGDPIDISAYKTGQKQELARRLHDEVAALLEAGSGATP